MRGDPSRIEVAPLGALAENLHRVGDPDGATASSAWRRLDRLIEVSARGERIDLLRPFG